MLSRREKITKYPSGLNSGHVVESGKQLGGPRKVLNTSQEAWMGFPIAQLVKNLPAMQETLVQFLGWEDPPEKG